MLYRIESLSTSSQPIFDCMVKLKKKQKTPRQQVLKLT